MVWKYRRRGERSMIGEIVIIVLGVMVALGAEQLVSALHWRADVAATRTAVDAELAGMIYQGYERRAVAPCLSARIRELSNRLRTSGAAWTGDPLQLRVTSGVEDMGRVLPSVYRAPSRLWTSDAWKMGIADGTVARLPREVANNYSQAYFMADNIRQMQDAEADRISDLSVLAVDQTLDTASRIAFQRDLAALDSINSFVALLALQLRDTLGPAHPALRITALRSEYERTIATQRRFRGACVRTDLDPQKA